MYLGRQRGMLRLVKTRPIAIGIFETTPALRLIGGRQRSSGRVVFPLPTDDQRFERVELPHRGNLWSYTMQRVAPKSPPYKGGEGFEPFAVGYVELPGACIVESRLTQVRFEELRVGMPMELTTLLLHTEADGTAVVIYAFQPAPTAQL
jgi:uncharacterized OB-fold protein